MTLSASSTLTQVSSDREDVVISRLGFSPEITIVLNTFADAPGNPFRYRTFVEITLSSEADSKMASPMGIDEGEIVESGSDKANTSPPSAQGLNVDRPSRSPLKAASLHDSNDEADYRPRGRTRSPYASTDSRDRKRGRDTYQDYGYDGPVYKSNSRQLKVAAEDRLSGESRRARVSYADLDYGTDVDEDRRHRDNSFDDRRGQKRQRTRSRSPIRRKAGYDDGQRTARSQWGDARRAGDRGQGAESRRIHTRRQEYHAAQSVSEQGYKPVPLGLSRHEAKSRMKGDSTHRDVDQTLSRFPRYGPSFCKLAIGN